MKRYFIQEWDFSYDDPDAGPHIEMFEVLENGYAGDYVFAYDGASLGECTEAFLAAKLWDGMVLPRRNPRSSGRDSLILVVSTTWQPSTTMGVGAMAEIIIPIRGMREAGFPCE